MKLFALSSFISMALALDVHIVTETAFHTVYPDGQAVEPSAAPEFDTNVVYVTVISDQFGNIITPSILNASNASNSTNSTSASESSYYTPESVSFTPQAPTTLVTRSSSVVVPTTSSTRAAETVQPTTQQPTPQQTSTKPATSTLSTSTAASTAASGSFQQIMLSTHNNYRSKHSAPALSWDSTLAQFASDYAANYDCSGSLTHSGGQYGENLAITSSGAAAAVKMWYDEVNEGYDYSSSFTSSQVSTFGHFTQLVWKSTTKLGCAEKQCSNYNYYICSYDPRGNVLGQGLDNISAN